MTAIEETAGRLAWRIAKRCDSGACVEAAPLGEGVAVRDSGGRVLTASSGAWKTLLGEIKAGRYDLGVES